MSDAWFYHNGTHPVGPITFRQLADVLGRATNSGEVLVWREGLADWARANELKELGEDLIQTPPPGWHTRPKKSSSTSDIHWALSASITLAAWITLVFIVNDQFKAGFEAYQISNFPILSWILALLFAALAVAALWFRKRQTAVGILVGTLPCLLLSALLARGFRRDQEAKAQGYVSASDMRAAVSLGLKSQAELNQKRAADAEQARAEAAAAAKAEAAKEACRSNWASCADNSQIANNYRGWDLAKVRCKREAESRARFGTPVWPWLSFSTYRSGTDYVKTGIGVLIEPDAQFQNGFGAMVHTKVTCSYSLVLEQVTNIDIFQR
jgi:hypothetical protein